MATERNVVDFKIHNLTEEQFQELKAQGQIDPNAVYCTPDESLKTDQITNCITEIPQDIKLELANGVLTLKAGSKVYVPNSAGVFDVRNINSDTVLSTPTGTNQWLCAVSASGTILTRPLSNCESGAGATATTGFAYDTTANNIGFYNTRGVLQYSNISLPTFIITTAGGVITSVDQVFNGFGYIGSTVFALPGVKGLIPNDRNEDGTLKNIEFAIDSVNTQTVPSGHSNLSFFLGSIGNILLSAPGSHIYDEKDNTYKSGNYIASRMRVGSVAITDGKITSFETNTTFHAVDYNDYQNIVDELKTKDEELNSSISAVDSGAVHKTGNETISGRKTFSENTVWNYAGADTSVLPSSAVYMSWNSVYAKNGIRLSYIETSYLTDGTMRTQYGTEKYIDGTKYVAYLRMEVKADKTTAITLGSNPSASSNSTHIATTAWVRDLFETLYPVGSLYISTGNSCPLTSIVKKSDGSNSTWALVAAGKALWTGNGTSGSGTTANANFANAAANTTIAAGAPNITGSFTSGAYENGTTPVAGQSVSGAFTKTTDTVNKIGSVDTYGNGDRTDLNFSAQDSNSVYGNSTTVQPPAYVVNVWRRTA